MGGSGREREEVFFFFFLFFLVWWRDYCFSFLSAHGLASDIAFLWMQCDLRADVTARVRKNTSRLPQDGIHIGYFARKNGGVGSFKQGEPGIPCPNGPNAIPGKRQIQRLKRLNVRPRMDKMAFSDCAQ